MAVGIAWLLVTALIAPANALQPVSKDVLELQAVVLRRAAGEDLVLRIRNISSGPAVLCVRTTTVRLNDVAGGEGMPHRCQAESNFDLVLAGESIFRRTPDVARNVVSDMIAVSVTVVMNSVLGGKEQIVTLTWDGTARQARQNGARIVASDGR